MGLSEIRSDAWNLCFMALSDQDKGLHKFGRYENKFLGKVWRTGKFGKILVTWYCILGLSPLIAEVSPCIGFALGFSLCLPTCSSESLSCPDWSPPTSTWSGGSPHLLRYAMIDELEK